MATLFRRLRRLVGRAVRDHGLIRARDRVAVGVSGGKDSYTLLEVLADMARRAPIPFTVKAVVLDQGFPDFATETVAEHLRAVGVEHRVVAVDTLAALEELGGPGGHFCSYCARQRRGLLYRATRRLGCNKLALAHHREDAIETLLMNLLFNGTLRGMPARLAATGSGRGLKLVRPLIYVPEDWIREHSHQRAFPCVPCNCPVGGTPRHRRQRVKELLASLEEEMPGVKASMLRSMRRVEAQQMLLDEGERRRLAAALGAGGAPREPRVPPDPAGPPAPDDAGGPEGQIG